MESTRKRWFLKYSPEFKQAAVDRFTNGESATAIADELKIRKKFLYAWRDAGFGSNPTKTAPERSGGGDGDCQQQQISRQQRKIAELERLTGQQAAQLDFFAAALRAVKEPRQKTGESSGAGSTRLSKV